MRIGDLQAQFDAALAGLIPKKPAPVGLAISGGGDSIALLHLAVTSELIDTERLRAFTVDHQLRVEAAQEACFVAGVCRRLGVSHETLIWRDPNPSQANARAARHRLLASAMRREGGKMLLTGHTLSDNSESFLIRTRASSGWYGLSGMGTFSASPVWPEGEGVFIGRPLLEMERAEIRNWARLSGYAWREDPSNENDKYERVRVRRLLADAPNIAARVQRLQKGFSELRRVRDKALAAWLVQADMAGDHLILPFPDDFAPEAMAQGLSLACMAVAGTSQPPRTQRSRSAANKLMERASATTVTVGGAIIRKRGGTLSFIRESNRPVSDVPVHPRLRLQHICTGLIGSAPI